MDQSRKDNEALKVKIQQLQEKHGIDIDEPLNIDLERIMADSTNKVHETYTPGSFLRLFWDQQLEAMKTKDRRQLRWHPMLNKWCLNSKLMSGRVYNSLRSTLILPSERTLKGLYTHCFESKAGFDVELDKQLMKVETCHVCDAYSRLLTLSIVYQGNHV